jgi:Domain of unknown function (DUF4190)
MASSPEQLPPPPAGGSSQPPTPSLNQAVGQQTAPSTMVPHTPELAAAQKPHNGLAMVSLITGILSYLGHIIPLIGGSTLAIVAIVTGLIARNQIKQTGEEGMTAATVGVVLGVANLALVILLILGALFFIFVLGVTIFGISASQH